MGAREVETIRNSPYKTTFSSELGPFKADRGIQWGWSKYDYPPPTTFCRRYMWVPNHGEGTSIRNHPTFQWLGGSVGKWSLRRSSSIKDPEKKTCLRTPCMNFGKVYWDLPRRSTCWAPRQHHDIHHTHLFPKRPAGNDGEAFGRRQKRKSHEGSSQIGHVYWNLVGTVTKYQYLDSFLVHASRKIGSTSLIQFTMASFSTLILHFLLIKQKILMQKINVTA